MFDDLTRRSLIKLMLLALPGSSRHVQKVQEPIGINTGAPILHPRLFYGPSTVRQLRTDYSKKNNWFASIQAHGETLLQVSFLPESEAMNGISQHANYGTPATQIAEMGVSLGLLYQVTQQECYAEKLKSALLFYAGYSRWTAPSFGERNPPWHSELDTAKFCFGFATAYDAIYDLLTSEERRHIRETLVRLGIQPILDDWLLPGSRIHAFDSMGHNWWGVCVSAAGLATLAIFEEEARAKRWIETIDDGLQCWFRYPGNVLQNRVRTFEPNGPSYEGVNYTNYGVSEYLHYRYAWENTFPEQKAASIPSLEHLAEFFLHTMYPTSDGHLQVNFNDSYLSQDPTQTVLLLLACGIQTADASRFLQRVKSQDKSVLTSLLQRPILTGDAPDVKLSMLYSHMGWAMLRNSWDDNAIMLAVKSGYTWNHAHADAGTFLLFKDGVPLIIDSGSCAYERPEYTTYYRQSVAHNVVLADGEGQPVKDVDYGCKFSGHVYSLVDGIGFKYVFADNTGPMARFFLRNYRHWVWSGSTILILDDIRAHTETSIDWLLHYQGDAIPSEDGGVILQNGLVKAKVQMLYPENRRIRRLGLAEHNPDLEVPYLSFAPLEKQTSHYLISVICLDPDRLPNVQVQKSSNFIHVRSVEEGTIHETYLNFRAINGSIHDNCAIVIDDFVTDAYMLQLEKDRNSDAVTGIFISDGSYLRRNNKSLAESLKKFTAYWKTSSHFDLATNEADVILRFTLDSAPSRITVNGKPADTHFDIQNRSLIIHIP